MTKHLNLPPGHVGSNALASPAVVVVVDSNKDANLMGAGVGV